MFYREDKCKSCVNLIGLKLLGRESRTTSATKMSRHALGQTVWSMQTTVSARHTVVTETHREAAENLINLSSAQVFAKHAASFRSIAHAWQVVEFWIAKVHRAAKYGVFCCGLTPFRRFDTIRAD